MKRPAAATTVIVLALGSVAVPPASATFPGSAGQIAYEEFVGRGIEIFTMNADGTNRGPVTATPNLFEQNPAWAPDGSKIVFDADGSRSSDIEMMNPDGTGREKLTNTNDLDEYSPAFSPDGTRVAFVRYTLDGDADVWAMNLDGSGLQNLTEVGNATSGIDWRSDGEAIVFTGITDDDLFVLYQYLFATGESTQLTFPVTDASDFDPDYSPDGTKVAFIRHGPGAGDATPMVIGADGSNAHTLDHEGSSLGISWSPEGDRVVQSESGEPSTITLVAPDGSPGRTVLVNEDAGQLSWQPCSDDCTITGVRPSVTQVSDAYRSSKRKTTVVASVSPTSEGASVTFVIHKRRDGKYRKILKRKAQIGSSGNASLAFRVSKKGKCRAKAMFEGTAENEPSSDGLNFPCKGINVG